VRMRVLVITSVLMIVAPSVQTGATEAAEQPWTIPDCAKDKLPGKQVRTLALNYVVPKHAIVKKFRDVDYGGYRVLQNQNGKWDVLTLVWAVNGSPFPSQAEIKDSLKYAHRILKLPDGRQGIDARGTLVVNGTEREWRSAGVMALYGSYRDVSVESARYFDAIIDSVCYQPR
jgi:hypothetical protein